VERGSGSKSRYHSRVYPALTTRTIGNSSLVLLVDHVCQNLLPTGQDAGPSHSDGCLNLFCVSFCIKNPS
jgi:hypothetical protein